jgi:hypothetical protein
VGLTVESGSDPKRVKEELGRLVCSPVVQWEGSSSLVISSRQRPSTTTTKLHKRVTTPAKSTPQSRRLRSKV